MPRGGARPGAGRKPNPAKTKAVGHVDARGQKLPDAPAGWPFGTEPPPAPPPPPAQPPAPQPDLSELTPLDFLLEVMRDAGEDTRLRIQAAQLAAPYVHVKKGDVGKKAAKQDAADKAAGGKFSTAPPPKLVVNNGK